MEHWIRIGARRATLDPRRSRTTNGTKDCFPSPSPVRRARYTPLAQSGPTGTRQETGQPHSISPSSGRGLGIARLAPAMPRNWITCRAPAPPYHPIRYTSTVNRGDEELTWSLRVSPGFTLAASAYPSISWASAGFWSSHPGVPARWFSSAIGLTGSGAGTAPAQDISTSARTVSRLDLHGILAEHLPPDLSISK